MPSDPGAHKVRTGMTADVSESTGSGGSRTGCFRPAPGTCGVRMGVSASGGRSVRTTAPMARRGTTCRTIMHAHVVNPDQRGTKCAFWYRLTLQPGASAELRLRLRPSGSEPTGAGALGTNFDRVITARRAEADEF